MYYIRKQKQLLFFFFSTTCTEKTTVRIHLIRRRVCPPPGSGGHSHQGGERVGGPNSDEGTNFVGIYSTVCTSTLCLQNIRLTICAAIAYAVLTGARKCRKFYFFRTAQFSCIMMCPYTDISNCNIAYIFHHQMWGQQSFSPGKSSDELDTDGLGVIAVRQVGLHYTLFPLSPLPI